MIDKVAGTVIIILTSFIAIAFSLLIIIGVSIMSAPLIVSGIIITTAKNGFDYVKRLVSMRS